MKKKTKDNLLGVGKDMLAGLAGAGSAITTYKVVEHYTDNTTLAIGAGVGVGTLIGGTIASYRTMRNVTIEIRSYDVSRNKDEVDVEIFFSYDDGMYLKCDMLSISINKDGFIKSAKINSDDVDLKGYFPTTTEQDIEEVIKKKVNENINRYTDTVGCIRNDCKISTALVKANDKISAMTDDHYGNSTEE